MIINKYKKYNSVAAREWPNNTYSYNKNNEKLLSHKKDVINKIIIDHSNLTKKENSFKSRRMRNLIKRSSLMRLFVSKSITKHTNDKINVSIHTFNRRKSKMLKNLFILNKFLNKFKKLNLFNFLEGLKNINNHNNNNLLGKTRIENNNLAPYINKLNLIDYLKGKNIYNIKYKQKLIKPSLGLSLYLTKKNNSNYYNIYMKNMYYNNFDKHNTLKKDIKNKINIKTNKLTKLNKKVLLKKKKLRLQKNRNLLYKRLMKTIPWSFEKKKIILYKMISLRLFYSSILKNMGLSFNVFSTKNLCVINVKSSNTDLLLNKNKEFIFKLPNRYSNIYNNFEINKLNKEKMVNISKQKIIDLKFERYLYINNLLEKITNLTLIKFNSTNYQKQTGNLNITLFKNKLYEEFKKYNTEEMFTRFFGKQYIILDNVYNLYIDNNKYVGLSNNLKYLMNKIYNKEINLNITELKYLYLNADMLSNAMIVKLTNMKNRLNNVIRKTLKLSKLRKLQPTKTIHPSKVNSKSNITFNYLINEMYNSTSISLQKKTFDEFVQLNIKNKTKQIIKNLKHKWTTGIRIEAKGRLTNRFASGRSMYQYRAKGNLRSKLKYENFNYSINTESKFANNEKNRTSRNVYVPLFRGILIPNLQYVKKSSFRRIGSFGVKLWINNNS